MTNHNLGVVRYFILPVKDRSVTVVHRKGKVLRIDLNQPRLSLSKVAKTAKQNFPSARRLTDSRIKSELLNYFSGKIEKFHLKYDLPGLTQFQREVLKETARIKWGRFLSYSALAKKLGNSDFRRAVATALSRNPVPIVIPCHRVINKDGQPGGFMGKKDDKTGWKRFLLDIESR